MKYDIIKQAQDITTLGYSIDIQLPEDQKKIFEIWNRFNADRAKIPYALGTAYGVSTFIDGRVKYSAVMEVAKIDHVPDGMVELTIPAQSYAQFIHHGPVWEVGQTCEKIYQTLPATDLKTAGSLIEVYSKDIKGEGAETVPVLVALL